MSLIEIESDAETVCGLIGLNDVTLIDSTLADMGGGRYTIAAYAPEERYADLMRRGCRVAVTISTQQQEAFHRALDALVG